MIRGTIEVAQEVCKGCELCITSCPQESIGLSDRINALGYRVVELVRDNCTGCVNCALVCPEGAISVYRLKKPAPVKNPALAEGVLS
jgi:2-oxoglutarate ferredoxin oxidoreductase subunit delta